MPRVVWERRLLTADYQDVDLSKQQEAMYIESKDDSQIVRNQAMGGLSHA